MVPSTSARPWYLCAQAACRYCSQFFYSISIANVIDFPLQHIITCQWISFCSHCVLEVRTSIDELQVLALIELVSFGLDPLIHKFMLISTIESGDIHLFIGN